MVTFEQLVEVMQMDLAEEGDQLYYTARGNSAFLMLDQSDRSEGIICIRVFEVQSVSHFIERLRERLEVDGIELNVDSAEVFEAVWDLLIQSYCTIQFDE